jgi:site-specific DNA-cytosine methylase
MKVLVACEFSQAVTKAFRDRGHEAYSCDLLPTEGEESWHLLGDIFDYTTKEWDLMIAHPPCTYLAVSGARWFKDRVWEQEEAIAFVEALWLSSIPKIAIENPVGVLSTKSCLGKPAQIIQPYQFGHPEPKKTCLWLKNLPLLIPTHEVEPEEYTTFSSGKKMPTWYSKLWGLPKEERQKARSRTFIGIAEAMAEQWG